MRVVIGNGRVPKLLVLVSSFKGDSIFQDQDDNLLSQVCKFGKVKKTILQLQKRYSFQNFDIFQSQNVTTTFLENYEFNTTMTYISINVLSFFRWNCLTENIIYMTIVCTRNKDIFQFPSHWLNSLEALSYYRGIKLCDDLTKKTKKYEMQPIL